MSNPGRVYPSAFLCPPLDIADWGCDLQWVEAQRLAQSIAGKTWRSMLDSSL